MLKQLGLRSPDPLESSKSIPFFFLDTLVFFLSILRSLDGPAKSADVSTTVSGNGRLSDGDSSTLLEVVEGSFSFFLLFFLRRLGGPVKSADVSTTVSESEKERFLDERFSLLEEAEGLEAKILSISDMSSGWIVVTF